MPVYERKMYRCTHDNEILEDVSDILVDATIAMDPVNEQTWDMAAVVTYQGWKERLSPYEDWLAPWLRVEYENGLVREGQLGLYFVFDSPEDHPEFHASDQRVMVEAYDPVGWVARQGFTDVFEIRENRQKDHSVRDILDGAVLTETEGGRPRYAIPQSNERFKKDMDWSADDNRLVVVNEILQGMGYYPLWSTKQGILTSRRRGDHRLKQRHPVRVYSANLPPNVILEDRYLPLGGLASEVVGRISTTPKGQDQFNEILIVNDDPSKPGIRVRGRITNPRNPRSTHRKRGRRRSRKIHNPVVEEDGTAKEVTRALLEELSTLNSVAKLQVVPDPEPEFAHETVSCKIYNAAGDPILDGQYAVHRVTYGLRPSQPTMTLDIGRIDDADDILVELD